MAQLHEEGDGNCPSPSSSWGCAVAPCFFFLAVLRCNIAALFFSFFLLLRYEATITFLYGGDFFFLLYYCLCFSSIELTIGNN